MAYHYTNVYHSGGKNVKIVVSLLSIKLKTKRYILSTFLKPKLHFVCLCANFTKQLIILYYYVLLVAVNVCPNLGLPKISHAKP